MSEIQDAPKKPLALVVDDDPSFRLLVSAVAKRAGYEAITAKDGLEALELVKHHAPVMIFTDLDMPEMNGIDLIKNLRADGLTVPILMISGNIEWDEARVVAIGGSGFLSKPFDIKEALSKITKLAA